MKTLTARDKKGGEEKRRGLDAGEGREKGRRRCERRSRVRRQLPGRGWKEIMVGKEQHVVKIRGYARQTGDSRRHNEVQEVTHTRHDEKERSGEHPPPQRGEGREEGGE